MFRKFLGWKNTSQKNHESSDLCLESLEDRMMLSTVSIHASGGTGQETLTVITGSEVRTFENVSTQGDVFQFETLQPIEGDVVIEFNNDLYLPEQGIDRNLSVEKIVVDGRETFSTDQSVFAVGVWSQEAGDIVSGSGLGPTLHSNGSFTFAVDSTPDNNVITSIPFANDTWDVVDGTATTETLSSFGDTLTISGVDGPLAISTLIEFETGDEVFELQFNASRDVIEGQFSPDFQPYATFGIDYYDAAGNKIEGETFNLNTPNNNFVFTEIQNPSNATVAALWIWVDGSDEGVNIPLRFSSFDLTFLNPTGPDTSPPEIGISGPITSVIDDSTIGVPVFVSYNDDNGDLIFRDDAIIVEGPNGYSGFIQEDLHPSTRVEFPGGNSFIAFAGLTPPADGEFGSDDNGIYSVRIAEGGFTDLLGNATPGRFIGTFELNLS